MVNGVLDENALIVLLTEKTPLPWALEIVKIVPACFSMLTGIFTSH